MKGQKTCSKCKEHDFVSHDKNILSHDEIHVIVADFKALQLGLSLYIST